MNLFTLRCGEGDWPSPFPSAQAETKAVVADSTEQGSFSPRWFHQHRILEVVSLLASLCSRNLVWGSLGEIQDCCVSLSSPSPSAISWLLQALGRHAGPSLGSCTGVDLIIMLPPAAMKNAWLATHWAHHPVSTTTQHKPCYGHSRRLCFDGPKRHF